MPETRYEKLDDILANIICNHGIQISTYDIEDAFRLGKYDPTRTRPRPILAKFLSLKAKKEIYTLRNSLYWDEESRIYLGEDLNKQQSDLFYAVRQVSKEHDWSVGT